MANQLVARDAAFYWPGTCVVVFSDSNKFINIPDGARCRKLIQREKEYISKRGNRIKAGVLPPRIKDFLDHGKTWNGRAIACYASGCTLAEMPLDDDDIIRTVLESPFPRTDPRDNDYMSDVEIIRNVRNGIKQIRKKTEI